MQMCMRPSVPRPPPSSRKKGRPARPCVNTPPMGLWMATTTQAGHHMAGVRIRARVSIVVMLWRAMVVYVIVWQ